MVRFLHLRHRGRVDLRQALLSQRRSTHRDFGGLRHLLHRIRRPLNRRCDIRPLRRSHRAQSDADCHAAVHGHRDFPGRLCAHLPGDRHLGGSDLDCSADDPGDRRRRGMGRFGAAGVGMGASPWPPGLVASWSQFGVPCGLFLSNLSTLAFSAWSGDQFTTWGWRIPFALSIILVGVGLWIRLGILETPVFRQLLNARKIEKAPIVEVIKKQPKEIMLSALLRMSEQAPF